MAQCEAFLVAFGLLPKGGSFFTPQPRREAPLFIVAWIMHS